MRRDWIAGFLAIGLFLLTSCGNSPPSPRERVLSFVRLIQTDSLPDVLPYVDIDSLAIYEYAEAKYSALSFQDKKNRLVEGFLRQGEYRGVWSKSQIVVNLENFLDDTTATVEVSFIDRRTRIQYYSQMGLKLRNQSWIICSFKVN